MEVSVPFNDDFLFTGVRYNAGDRKVKEVVMKLTKETIWHFTCDFCKLWWSFASSDEFQPRRNIFCPHCGKENKIEN